MPNNFVKDIQVAWEKMVEGFQDALVMSRNIAKFTADAKSMERSNNVMWLPQPYILPSYDGSDQTGNFNDKAQLAVPVTIGFRKSVPWRMSDTELLDDLQEGRLGKAAYERLASDINVAVLTVASTQGTLIQTSSSAASGFADVANAEAMLNRVGIPGGERYISYSTADYNLLAKDLANRQNMVAGLTQTAYERALIGPIAGFQAFKMDYALSQAAALGGAGLTIDTRASASNYYVPVAVVVGSTGESPVDNRYQTITISSTTNVKAGDCFTIANVYEVNHITKQATLNLKTFRVIQNLNSTQLVISPPIISNQGGSQAEVQYQNCSVSSTSASAAIVFLNTTLAYANPFWHKEAMLLTPGRMAPPMDAGAMIKRATTENGIEITMWQQTDINTGLTKFRCDVRFGVTMVQPEMAGIQLFAQS